MNAEPQKEPQNNAASHQALREQIIAALKTCYDPEIPIDIWELGLIYDIGIDEKDDVTVTMTLTTPHCPAAETLPVDVE